MRSLCPRVPTTGTGSSQRLSRARKLAGGAVDDSFEDRAMRPHRELAPGRLERDLDPVAAPRTDARDGVVERHTDHRSAERSVHLDARAKSRAMRRAMVLEVLASLRDVTRVGDEVAVDDPAMGAIRQLAIAVRRDALEPD